MPNNDRDLKNNFNMLLTDSDDEALTKIASDLDVSKAHVLRSGLRSLIRMKYRRIPSCADSTSCRCPHAHIYPPALAAASHEHLPTHLPPA